MHSELQVTNKLFLASRSKNCYPMTQISDLFRTLGQTMEKDILSALLRSKKSVFTFKEVLLRWRNVDAKKLMQRINYYVKQGKLYPIRRGLYAKDKNYDRLEVATKIIRPAYISFETVLRNEGLIFQFYSQIFVASTHSRTITCDGQEYIFRTIKESILTNPKGVEINDNYSIASAERAFLDILYIYNDYYLDNPNPLNWEKVYEILPIYDNKRMKRKVDRHYALFKENLKETL